MFASVRRVPSSVPGRGGGRAVLGNPHPELLVRATSRMTTVRAKRFSKHLNNVSDVSLG